MNEKDGVLIPREILDFVREVPPEEPTTEQTTLICSVCDRYPHYYKCPVRFLTEDVAQEAKGK